MKSNNNTLLLFGAAAIAAAYFFYFKKGKTKNFPQPHSESESDEDEEPAGEIPIKKKSESAGLSKEVTPVNTPTRFGEDELKPIIIPKTELKAVNGVVTGQGNTIVNKSTDHSIKTPVIAPRVMKKPFVIPAENINPKLPYKRQLFDRKPTLRF